MKTAFVLLHTGWEIFVPCASICNLKAEDFPFLLYKSFLLILSFIKTKNRNHIWQLKCKLKLKKNSKVHSSPKVFIVLNWHNTPKTLSQQGLCSGTENTSAGANVLLCDLNVCCFEQMEMNRHVLQYFCPVNSVLQEYCEVQQHCRFTGVCKHLKTFNILNTSNIAFFVSNDPNVTWAKVLEHMPGRYSVRLIVIIIKSLFWVI